MGTAIDVLAGGGGGLAQVLTPFESKKPAMLAAQQKTRLAKDAADAKKKAKRDETISKGLELGTPKKAIPLSYYPVLYKMTADLLQWTEDNSESPTFENDFALKKGEVGNFVTQAEAIGLETGKAVSERRKNNADYEGEGDMENLWNPDYNWLEEDPNRDPMDILGAGMEALQGYKASPKPVDFDLAIVDEIAAPTQTYSKTDVEGNDDYMITKSGTYVKKDDLLQNTKDWIQSGIEGRNENAEALYQRELNVLEATSPDMSLPEKQQIAQDNATKYAYDKRLRAEDTTFKETKTQKKKDKVDPAVLTEPQYQKTINFQDNVEVGGFKVYTDGKGGKYLYGTEGTEIGGSRLNQDALLYRDSAGNERPVKNWQPNESGGITITDERGNEVDLNQQKNTTPVNTRSSYQLDKAQKVEVETQYLVSTTTGKLIRPTGAYEVYVSSVTEMPYEEGAQGLPTIIDADRESEMRRDGEEIQYKFFANGRLLERKGSQTVEYKVAVPLDESGLGNTFKVPEQKARQSITW